MLSCLGFPPDSIFKEVANGVGAKNDVFSPRMDVLRVNHLLHFGIYPDHPLVKVRMIPHQDIRIPRSSNKNSIDAAANWRHEDLADLESN